MEMRKLTLADWKAFEAFKLDWASNTSPFKIMDEARYASVEKESFPDYVEALKLEETSPAQADFSTADIYFAFIDGQIAGSISCRWQIEKGILLEWGGHIGYGVAPSFRGNHLAEEMLKFALGKYLERGILNVMISADTDNIASCKTIERNGGKLENVVNVDGEPVARYWVRL